MLSARPVRYRSLFLLVAVAAATATTLGAERPRVIDGFLSDHCFDCHSGDIAEGGLDLEALDLDLGDTAAFETWVRIHDRVRDGEMPPGDSLVVKPHERDRFVEAAGRELRHYQRQQHQREGRVQGRRLTNKQLERTLRDLLGIDIPLANRLPEDTVTAGFTTVADGQAMSHFQLDRHLSVVDAALDEAFRRAVGPEDEWERLLDAKTLCRKNPKRRTREPELIDGRAVTWSSRLIFYGRLPATEAKESGWYRFVIRASGLKVPDQHGVWCTVRSGRCVSSAPLLSWLGAFEVDEETKEMTFEGWLPKGHMLEVRPGDSTLKMARFRGGQVGVGEGDPQNVCGVAIESIKMARIHRGPNNAQIRAILFGDRSIDVDADGRPVLASDDPHGDADRLMRRFARRAFRRPIRYGELALYTDFVKLALDNGSSLFDGLRMGYRALLCSPRFLYFDESPGPLSSHAVANRLSYLLWGTMPDRELTALADAGRLQDPHVLQAQITRLLDDARSQRFVRDFAAEWLDLRLIDFTEPDRRLYPGFDIIVQQSMLDECHAFLDTLLREDLSIENLIDSEFTYLNSRLARYYDIAGVEGDELRRVELSVDNHRGGLLTQGAILKVTANGTTTSPVIRGVWVSERLLGQEIRPPPASVPAIEPDIRGAKSIRDMLAKHRSDDACNVCHVRFDPPGFALENFDPSGRWRDHYLQMKGRRRSPGAVIDASYSLADGRHFADLDEFRQLILADPQILAENFARKLLTYATGAPITFVDRDAVREIVESCAVSDYGMRSVVQSSIASPIFLTK